MLLSKHVWRIRSRGVLVACCSESTRTCFHLLQPPSERLPGSNRSFTKAFRSKHEQPSSVTQTVGDACSGSPPLGCKHGRHQRDEPPS
eukprot:c19530_g1_i1 orf=1-261(-)